MIERFVKASGLDLWIESFGDPGAPPILLIMGASAQSIRCPLELDSLPPMDSLEHWSLPQFRSPKYKNSDYAYWT